MITTKSGFKNALQESERDAFGNYTWRQAMSNIDYQTKLAEQQAKQLYGEDVATAYQAAAQQRATIAGSALGSGTKTALQQELANTLNTAYDQYMSNYQQNLSNIATQASSAYNELNKLLEERATYMGEYEQEHYKYLQSLDKWYQDQVTNATDNAAREQATKAYQDFMTGLEWSKFYNTSEQGSVLKSWEELSTPVMDPLTGEYVSLYDAKGNLTRAGRDFYDQMENYYATRVAKEGETLPPSFQQYLYSENEELYEWANQYNPYSYAPNLAGESTNVGAFKQLLGIESTDEQYSFLERLGGLSKTEIDVAFNDMFDDLSSQTMTMDNINDVVSNMRSIAEKLGFKSVDWQQVEKQTSTALEQYREYLATSEGNKSTAIAGYASAGVMMAIALGSMIASIASTATGIGAPAGIMGAKGSFTMAAGSLAAFNAASNQEERANYYKQLADMSEDQIKQMYLDSLTLMSAEMQNVYNKQMIANGGILGSKLGEGIKTLESLGGKSTDNNQFESNYAQFIAYNKNKSANIDDYKVKHLDYGHGYNKIRVTIDGTNYSLQIKDAVTNKNEIAALNKYTTGSKDTTPAKDKIIVLANKMYIYTRDGWKNVSSQLNNVDEAVKAYLK